jgi:hypothetical protein
MNTGPAVGGGYDLALTEPLSAGGHAFLVEVGTEEGSRILAQVPQRTATAQDVDGARAEVACAAGRMGRQMRAVNLRDLLQQSLPSRCSTSASDWDCLRQSPPLCRYWSTLCLASWTEQMLANPALQLRPAAPNWPARAAPRPRE